MALRKRRFRRHSPTRRRARERFAVSAGEWRWWRAGQAPVSGGSVFDRGASPTGGMPQAGGPPQAGGAADACMKGFVPLREEAEKRGKMIKAASDRKASPDEACKLIKNFGQAELKMIAYVQTNSAKCGIPPQIADQLKNGHKNTEKMQTQVCNVAQQAATRAPAGPSLSEVLGSSARARGPGRQEGRQHLRYAERQRSPAMTPAPMSEVTARVADATGNWVDTHAPSWSRPYLRLSRFDRPIGSWLLLMPCWWSAALAAGIARDVAQLPLVIVLFFIGAFVMRGAGCTWNDITDRDLDARVERTRSRPLPAGQVSVAQAFAFLVLQALIGLAVLLQFNRFAILTGIASLVIVAVYPFMKRITWWPQVVLGLAFSWGALMGFAVTLGRIDLTALVLYAGSIAWVIGYDTIYAHQDAEDDALIGVKSTARLFGDRTHRALVVFYSLAVVLIGVAFVLGGARWPAWIGLAAFAAHLVWQIRRLDIRDPALCLRVFKSNRDAGLLLFAGLLVDAVMRASA